MNRRIPALLAVLMLVVFTAACSSSGNGDKEAAGEELVGLLRFTPGAVAAGKVTGTYFRMLQPGGSATKGPYMVNSDSPADNGQATLLTPGTSGGLRIGGYQSQPTPGYDGKGNSLSDAINAPVKWFGVAFSISTNQVDKQTNTEVPPPRVVYRNGKLEADVSAWAASWNRQEFNQGAPKPVLNTGAKAAGQKEVERTWDWVAQKWLESAPKSTLKGKGAAGTYDPKTKAFTLEWTSYIEGGPFNGFTGLWHLEGVFEPSGRAPSGQE